MRSLRFYGSWLTGAALAASLSGCLSDDRREPTVTDPALSPAATTAHLTRATDCEDLLARIQADAIVKLDLAAEQALSVFENDGIDGWAGAEDGTFDMGPAIPPTVGGMELDGTGTGGGETTSSNAGSSDPVSTGPTSVSETNTQVAGVDEADIVKTDGENIYLLHGSELFVLDSFPAASTAITAQVSLEGTPAEMFVRDGKAVVFSTVWDDGTLEAAGSTEPADIDDYGYYGGRSYTKITVVAVSTAELVTTRELYVEGSYLSSRLHGNAVRALVTDGFRSPQYYPNLEYWDAFGREYDEIELELQIDDWKKRMTRDIEATELADWIPEDREKSADAISAIAPSCANYYIPDPGMTDSGITSIVTLDLDDIDAAPRRAAILGGGSTVYSSKTSLILAHNDWRAQSLSISAEQTLLHQFALDGLETAYTASGMVPGHVHNQFSIDEADGVIRVATTGNSWSEGSQIGAFRDLRTVNTVFTYQATDNTLVKLGSTGEMAPEERITSTRFIGDRAYVVTFRQVDPLFVVDLSDPASPTVLGELKIPGFSEYMHPLGDDHLLTIGREGTDDGMILGLALQIFDVSDATNPVLRHIHTMPGSSQVGWDHKAFTYMAEFGLLAFPRTSYETGFSSTLEVFRVNIEDGFQPLASIEHADLIVESCNSGGTSFDESYYYCQPSTDVRRGLFIDDHVYSISYGGVMVHNLNDFDTTVASVVLPQAYLYDGYYDDVGMSLPPMGEGPDVMEPGVEEGPSEVDLSEPSIDGRAASDNGGEPAAM